MSKDSMLFVGVDLGDKFSHVTVLDQEGELVEEVRLPTTRAAFERKFSVLPRSRVAMEVGTHSRWASQLLEEPGHEVLVANARKLRAIYDNPRKDDRVDAEMLARLARLDPKLLSPIHHRSPEAQADLTVIRSRDALVRSRTLLIDHARSTVKASGGRLPSCSADSFTRPGPRRRSGAASAGAPAGDRNRRLPHRADPGVRSESRRTQQGKVSRDAAAPGHRRGGPAYLSCLRSDPGKPRPLPHVPIPSKSREVGPALGLVPGRDQSGDQDPQRHITKTGDILLRRLLVGSGHYILGPFGPDCDLRRWGLKLAARGGKNAKKRAAVAVARKLAILMHHLWETGEIYQPLRQYHDEMAELAPVASTA